MDYTEQQQIDLLLSEIAEQGASADHMQQLEDLLRDRPDLQDYYAKLTRLNLLLAYELDGSLQHLQPLVDPERSRGQMGESHDVARCNQLSERLSRDLSAGAGSGGRRPQRASWIAAAVAVCLMAVAYQFYHGGLWSKTTPPMAIAPQTERNSVATKPSPDGELVVRDASALKVLSRLIRTDMMLSLRLPQRPLDGSEGATLCSGTAWMERAPGDHERGYLVALEPGGLMDVFVDTDAQGQNALGVVEIDRRGQMTGSTLSFNNLVEGNVRLTQRRTGSIGNYSVYNDGHQTKFYLFAGSHLLSDSDGEGVWHQSDYRVLHDSNHLLVIGWDDSGCTVVDEPHVPPNPDENRDFDFNDISAIIRFSGAGFGFTSAGNDVRYVPAPPAERETADDAERGYALDVKPGEELVMMVSSSAVMQNSIKIIEVPSREVLWQQDGTAPNTGKSPFQEGERGVYVVRNFSDRVQRIELYSRHQPDSSAPTEQWQTSPYKVLAEGDASITVGFEDSPDDPSRLDWNDIRVHARWFSM